MTWTSTLALCAASSATAAGLTALYFRSRLSAATASANLFATWWERDSGKMLIAQAELDLIHQQRVDAGKAAHAPWKALRAETTDALRECVERRNHIPAQASAAGKEDGSGQVTPDMPTGRGAVHSRRQPSGSRPAIRPAKSAGETARSIRPAETTTMKGAI